VLSGERARAAAVLKDREAFDVGTLIAVVDAAAWWLDQPHGDSYCTSLLNAVTDRPTVGAAYLALIGEPTGSPEGSAQAEGLPDVAVGSPGGRPGSRLALCATAWFAGQSGPTACGGGGCTGHDAQHA